MFIHILFVIQADLHFEPISFSMIDCQIYVLTFLKLEVILLHKFDLMSVASKALQLQANFKEMVIFVILMFIDLNSIPIKCFQRFKFEKMEM